MDYSNTAILAFFVHLIVNFDIFRDNRSSNTIPAGKSYRRYLWSVAVFYISDALWGVLYEAHFIPAVFADTVVYFAVVSATVYLWTCYVIDYLEEPGRFNMILHHTGRLFLAFVGIVLVLNCFVPLMFWFDKDGVYHAGNMRYVILIVQVVLFLFSAFYVLITAKKKQARVRRRHLAIGLLGIAMTLLIVFQVLYPLLPLYSVGCLLGTCILHTFVLADQKEDRRLELEEMLRREQEYEQELGSTRRMAYTDSLTGVRNVHAYEEAKMQVDERINTGELEEFGIIVFDVNDLKKINDTKGHEMGDLFIKEACHLICREFKHSPVFRIGGDEFVVLLEGEDYQNREKLLLGFNTIAEEHMQTGAVVVASGLAVFLPGQDNSCSRIFNRADKEMYDRKRELKSFIAGA